MSNIHTDIRFFNIVYNQKIAMQIKPNFSSAMTGRKGKHAETNFQPSLPE
jgi:hypothetical protein